MERAHVEVDGAHLMAPRTGDDPGMTHTFVAPPTSMWAEARPPGDLSTSIMGRLTDWSESLSPLLLLQPVTAKTQETRGAMEAPLSRALIVGVGGRMSQPASTGHFVLVFVLEALGRVAPVEQIGQPLDRRAFPAPQLVGMHAALRSDLHDGLLLAQ